MIRVTGRMLVAFPRLAPAFLLRRGGQVVKGGGANRQTRHFSQVRILSPPPSPENYAYRQCRSPSGGAYFLADSPIMTFGS